MLSDRPDQVCVWTEDGVDAAAAEVGLSASGSGGLRVLIASRRSRLKTVMLRWHLSLPPGCRILADHWERGYGDLEWRSAAPERALPWYALVHEPGAERTTGFGVETGAASLASWRIDATGVSLVLDVRNGGIGVALGDRVLPAATIRTLSSEPGESAYAFARRFCALLCPSPRLPGEPVYGGNDWYCRYGDMTAETVKEDAGLLRELTEGCEGTPTFVADCGWFPARGCEGGPYDRGHEGFPDMPGLAASIEAMGVRPGIWIRPLLSSVAIPQAIQLPATHPLGPLAPFTMDPSLPETLEIVRADISRLVEWGYRAIKHDFSTYDITGSWGFLMGTSMTRDGWHFADRSRTTAEITTEFYRAIREAAGSTWLIGCNTIGHLAAGLHEIQRTGDDTSGKDWERTRKMGVNTLAFRMAQHDTFFAHDADCVGVRPEIPWERNRQWLDVVARSATPLFVSMSRETVGPREATDLREAFRPASQAQPPAEPLDWFDTTCPRRWRFGDEVVEYDWIDPVKTVFPCA